MICRFKSNKKNDLNLIKKIVNKNRKHSLRF